MYFTPPNLFIECVEDTGITNCWGFSNGLLNLLPISLLISNFRAPDSFFPHKQGNTTKKTMFPLLIKYLPYCLLIPVNKFQDDTRVTNTEYPIPNTQYPIPVLFSPFHHSLIFLNRFRSLYVQQPDRAYPFGALFQPRPVRPGPGNPYLRSTGQTAGGHQQNVPGSGLLVLF